MLVVVEVLEQDPLVIDTLYTPLAVGAYVFDVALGITTSSLYQAYVVAPEGIVKVVLLVQPSPITVIAGVDPVMATVKELEP
jgi:hypothetical protein